MNLARFVVFVAAGFFMVYGLAFSFMPTVIALLVTGSEPEGVSALIDFRATYGGMTVAFGLALFYLYFIQQVRACLIIVILVLLSMAVTRTAGFFVNGSGNFLMYAYLVFELLGSSLAGIALRGQVPPDKANQ